MLAACLGQRKPSTNRVGLAMTGDSDTVDILLLGAGGEHFPNHGVFPYTKGFYLLI